MPEKRKGFTDSFKESLKSVQKKAMKEGYFSKGTDAIIYALLLVGILLTFYNIYWGALIIGAVGGFVFSQELLIFFRNFHRWILKFGMGKAIVLGSVIFFLLIAVPTGVIAAMIAALSKEMIASRR